MKRYLGAAALVLAVLGTGAGTGTASARDAGVILVQDDMWVPSRDRCDPRYDDCRMRRDDGGDGWRDDRRGEWRDGDRGFERRGCTPGRALRKADRMGIHRARIVDVGRRTVDVAGRKFGQRIVVTFGRRDPSCPILR